MVELGHTIDEGHERERHGGRLVQRRGEVFSQCRESIG